MLAFDETISITKDEYIALQRTARKVDDVRLYDAIQRSNVMKNVKALLQEQQRDVAEVYLWLYQKHEQRINATYQEATAYFGCSARTYYNRLRHLEECGFIHIHISGRVTITALEVA